jgi:hypothetical protein
MTTHSIMDGIGHGRPDTSFRPDLSSPKIMPRFLSDPASPVIPWASSAPQIINPLGRSAGYSASWVWIWNEFFVEPGQLANHTA